MNTINPQFDTNLAIVFTRHLSPDEKTFVQNILEYVQKSILHENTTPVLEWLDHDVLVTELFTHRVQGLAFFETLEELLEEGSPPRKTDRVGPVGSRLIPTPSKPVEIRYVFTDVDDGTVISEPDHVRNLAVTYINRNWKNAEVTPVPAPAEIVSADYQVKTTKRTFTLELDIPDGATEVTVTIKL